MSTTPRTPRPLTKPAQHTLFEDAQGILIGTLLSALGITFFKSTGLLIGGTAGLAFLGQYATAFSFSEMFFVINLPFYYYAPYFMEFKQLEPLYAALIGGLLVGSGLLGLFRHQASLGGLTILAQYLAQEHGVSIGKFQMGVDCVVLLLAIFIIDWQAIALSIVGAVSYNLILVINHKPGRYSA